MNFIIIIVSSIHFILPIIIFLCNLFNIVFVKTFIIYIYLFMGGTFAIKLSFNLVMKIFNKSCLDKFL